MATSRCNLEVSVTPKRWFGHAFTATAYACAIISFVSPRAAEWLSDKLCACLVRYGYSFRCELV